ncbi:hypothetical protein K502DRAFT_325193 [Neoconidiobolus thromboides FSU 785]|nr:hypothetical protein K502DRAFT_325193 [Neoconidiobolus thromboides FSU 785]
MYIYDENLYQSVWGPLMVSVIASYQYSQLSSKSWYKRLRNPKRHLNERYFTLLSIISSSLYGYAYYIVKMNYDKDSYFYELLGYLFNIQLLLDSIWSLTYIGANASPIPLISMAGLWIANLIALFFFGTIDTTALLYFIPYFLWTSFRSYLNLQLSWLLNADNTNVDSNQPTHPPAAK